MRIPELREKNLPSRFPGLGKMKPMLLRGAGGFGLCLVLLLTGCPQWPWEGHGRRSFREPPAETFRIHTLIVNQVKTRVACVSKDFFRTSEVPPILGRAFVPAELDASRGVAMMSYDYWQAGFGGNPEMIGKTLEISNEPHTVVGILPPHFLDKENVAMFLPAGDKSCADSAGL
jgi:hypothetical protein